MSDVVHEASPDKWGLQSATCLRCGRTSKQLGLAALWTQLPELVTCSGDTSRRGAVVEIIDPKNKDVLLPSRVLINGVDVGYTVKGSLRINPGSLPDAEPATVTLTLMPSRIIIRGSE